MKSSEKDFEFIVESCKKLGYEINIISKPTTTERKMIERSLKQGDVVVKKAKIGGAITTLSRLQIQLMSVGISNEDYNDISEMIGDIKERLANIA
jgi:hypothetical protein